MKYREEKLKYFFRKEIIVYKYSLRNSNTMSKVFVIKNAALDTKDFKHFRMKTPVDIIWEYALSYIFSVEIRTVGSKS